MGNSMSFIGSGISEGLQQLADFPPASPATGLLQNLEVVLIEELIKSHNELKLLGSVMRFSDRSCLP